MNLASLIFTGYVCIMLSRVVVSDRLCERIFFKLPLEDKFPYYIVEGVYKRTNRVVDSFPIFEHEQGGMYFQYLSRAKKLFFGHSVGSKDYVGLAAVVRSSFYIRPGWIRYIRDSARPFKQLIKRWIIYDPIIKKHKMLFGAIEAICVKDHTFLCTSQKVFFNPSLNDGSKVLHDIKTDYFSEIKDVYAQNRPVFKHSRTKTWFLFYADQHWVVGPNYHKASGFIKVKTTVRRPEYVTSNWQMYNGKRKRWEFFANPVSARCKGVKPATPGNICGAIKSLCPAGTPCYKNILNETVCKCSPSKRGALCSSNLGRCPRYQFNSLTESTFISQRGYDGDSLVVFCAKSRQPGFLIGICRKSSIGSNYVWIKKGTCRKIIYPTSRRPYWTTQLPYPSKRPNPDSSKKHTKPFNADDYIWIEPTVLSLAIVLQIVTPAFFVCCDVKLARTTSMFMFCSMVLWAIFLLGCYGTKCGKHGRIFADLIIMALVMLPVGYIFHLIESCYSTEREYVSMVIQDTSLRAYLDLLKGSGVTITGNVECYHMETRTRTVYYTDSNGNTQTRIETYQEIVVTYTESQVFAYSFYRDISPVDLPPLDAQKVTRLKIIKEVVGGDQETKDALFEFQRDLIEKNKHRDVHINYYQNEDIPNYREHVCAYLDRVEKPFWMNSASYWLATLLCLTWPYRWYFQLRTGKSEYILRKAVYLNGAPSENVLTASAPQLQDMYHQPLINQPIPLQPYTSPTNMARPAQETQFQTPYGPQPDYNTAVAQTVPFQYYNPSASHSNDNLVQR